MHHHARRCSARPGRTGRVRAVHGERRRLDRLPCRRLQRPQHPLALVLPVPRLRRVQVQQLAAPAGARRRGPSQPSGDEEPAGFVRAAGQRVLPVGRRPPGQGAHPGAAVAFPEELSFRHQGHRVRRRLAGRVDQPALPDDLPEHGPRGRMLLRGHPEPDVRERLPVDAFRWIVSRDPAGDPFDK